MRDKYERASESHMDTARNVVEENEESVGEVSSEEDILTVFTNVRLPSKPQLNSICKSVDDHSDITWGLVFKFDDSGRFIMNFVENPNSPKALYQMYCMVNGSASSFVRENRKNNISEDMKLEDLADAIIEGSLDEVDRDELVEKLEEACITEDCEDTSESGNSAFDW